MAYLYVFIGGGLGSMFRYGISRFFPFTGDGFPTGTLVANVISSFILGIFLGIVLKYQIPYHQRLLLMTGFCGGFSTFSTFSAEGVALLEKGYTFLAIGYIIISIVTGLAAILIGMKIFGN